MHVPVETRRVEPITRDAFKLVAEAAQERLDAGLADPLGERLFIVREVAVCMKELRVAQNVAGHLDALTRRLHDLPDPDSLRRRGRAVYPPGPRQEGSHAGGALVGRQRPHAPFLESEQLLRIETGRRAVHTLQ